MINHQIKSTTMRSVIIQWYTRTVKTFFLFTYVLRGFVLPLSFIFIYKTLYIIVKTCYRQSYNGILLVEWKKKWISRHTSGRDHLFLLSTGRERERERWGVDGWREKSMALVQTFSRIGADCHTYISAGLIYFFFCVQVSIPHAWTKY